MRTLLSHPNVDEVLLLHANPKTAFEFVHPKVVNIDAIEYNDEMGLSLRFYFCQLARNDWVIHVDDDMEFTVSALNELLIEFSRNPHRIVGRFGRDLTLGNSFNGYNSKDTHKATEVILTKLMVMERQTCGAFFSYAHLVWNDVVLALPEGPLWNGECCYSGYVMTSGNFVIFLHLTHAPLSVYNIRYRRRYFHVACCQSCVWATRRWPSVQQFCHGLAGCLASRRLLERLQGWQAGHKWWYEWLSHLGLALVANLVASKPAL